MKFKEGFKEMGKILGICSLGVILMSIVLIAIAFLIGFFFKLELNTALFVSLILALVIVIVGGGIWLSKE